MVALWIIIGIILFAAALLSISVTIYVTIAEEVDIRIGILGWKKKIDLESKEEEPSKKSSQKAGRRKKKSTKPQKPDQKASDKSFGETVQFGILLFKSIASSAAKFTSHIRITSLRLHMTVACGEADKTAVTYGGVSAGIYTLLGLLDSNLSLKIKSVHIAPDFVSGQAVYDIFFKVKLRFCHILKAFIGILFKSMVNTMSSRKGNFGGLQPNKSKTLNKAVQ